MENPDERKNKSLSLKEIVTDFRLKVALNVGKVITNELRAIYGLTGGENEYKTNINYYKNILLARLEDHSEETMLDIMKEVIGYANPEDRKWFIAAMYYILSNDETKEMIELADSFWF